MLNLIRKWVSSKAQDGPLAPLDRLFQKAMRDPKARPGFYTALLGAELLVSGRMQGPGEVDLQFYDVAGEKVLPVFSHEDRLRKVLGPEAPILKFSGADLIRSVAPGRPMALNPYSDFGREFSVEELKDILESAPQ
jgi:hypothetical protein